MEMRSTRSTTSRCRFFFSSRRRHTRFDCDWSSDVCSSDLKGTCGVLVMALHAQAAQRLGQAFAGQEVRKQYLALVRGWLPDAVEVDHALRPDDAPEDAPAQPAQTSLRCLARLEWPEAFDPRHAATRISLVEALPATGRRHQIRRHLKHVAHPIIGDATHGKGPLNRWWAERLGLQRLWLRRSEEQTAEIPAQAN